LLKLKIGLTECPDFVDHYSIDASELLGTIEQKATSTRAPRPPKYAYLDDNGQQQTWTGQGRQPLPIRRAIESGAKNLEDFLINA
jgi:DNA-binding protein H-NS